MIKAIDEKYCKNDLVQLMPYSSTTQLITSKDGVINATWFKLEFVKKDVFKLTTSSIPVIEPTIDDVINYSSTHTIAKTNDPEEDEESKFSEAVSRILDLKSDVKIKKIDYHA